MRGRPWGSILAQGLVALALCAVLVWPLVATLIVARQGREGGDVAGGGLMRASKESAVPRPVALAGESARVVLGAVALALPIGVPLAWVLFRTDVWARGFLRALLLLAAFVPLPLHATAWLGAFGNAGRMQALGAAPLLVGWSGAAFVHALAALPWIVLLVGIGLRAVEPELEEAALLELPAWRVLTRVTLRRSLGALAGATVAVAVLTAGDMTVTDLLQVRTYAEEAYVQYQLGQGPGAAASVALPPLIVLGLLLVLVARGLLRLEPARLASIGATGRVWRLGRARFPLGLFMLVTVGNLAALPLYGLVWRAGRVGGSAALGRPPHWSLPGLLGTLDFAAREAIGPLRESLVWSSVGASATVALAWSLAWLSRRPGPWRWVTVGGAALALATPGPVAGMALVLAYRAVPAVYDSALPLVLAEVLRTWPYALLVLWPTLRALPPGWLEAAALEGYGPARRVLRVALPASRSTLVAAWVVAFVLALGELPATDLVVPPGLMPMSVFLWSLLHTGVESHLAGVALVLLAAVAVAGLLAALALSRIRLPRVI